MTKFQYYAQEKNQHNFQNPNSRLITPDFLIIEEVYFTPFSGRFNTLEDAQKWYGLYGDYWKGRGIKLKLLETEREKDW